MGIETSHAQGPDVPPVRDITVVDLLRAAADAVPDRSALIAGVADPAARREWTYRELLEEARRVARALRSRFEPGERVAVWAHNVPEWVLLEYGCALAGVVLVTVNPAFRESEARFVLAQSRSAGIFVVPELRGNPMHAVALELQAELPELREVVSFVFRRSSFFLSFRRLDFGGGASPSEAFSRVGARSFISCSIFA